MCNVQVTYGLLSSVILCQPEPIEDVPLLPQVSGMLPCSKLPPSSSVVAVLLLRYDHELGSDPAYSTAHSTGRADEVHAVSSRQGCRLYAICFATMSHNVKV